MSDRTWMLTIAILFAALVPYAISRSEGRTLGPAIPKGPPATTVPFGLAEVAPPEGSLPSGWEALTGEETAIADAPTADALRALASSAGTDPAHVQVRSVSMQRGTGETAQQGVAGWVVVDTAARPFAEALTAAANDHGWKIRPVGTQCVLASWGSAPEATQAVLDWQVEVAVRQFCQAAHDHFVAGLQVEDPARGRQLLARSRVLAAAAGTTEPEAGMFHALMGRMLAPQNPAAAIEHYRRALRKGAPIQPPKAWIVGAAYAGGQALLQRQSQHVLEEALFMLQQGVAAEEESTPPLLRFGNRYNLACTYARLGKKDEAFAELEESLRGLQAAEKAAAPGPDGAPVPRDYASNYKHALEVDPDMATLREDPRWEPLMAKYRPEPGEPAEDDGASDDGGADDK